MSKKNANAVDDKPKKEKPPKPTKEDEKRRKEEEKARKQQEKLDAKQKKKSSGGGAASPPPMLSRGNVGLTNGKTIEEMAQSAENPVPLFLEKCIQFIEAGGLDSEGIYRVPGNRAQVDALFQKFDQGKWHICWIPVLDKVTSLLYMIRMTVIQVLEWYWNMEISISDRYMFYFMRKRLKFKQ